MSITDTEFAKLLADTSKTITGDLRWREDEDRSPAVVFRTRVASAAGWPLVVVGRFNPLASKLSYVLIHDGVGRIYALDLGADHHNPTCQQVGDLHKHSWTEKYGDKLAYVPADIQAGLDAPVDVWSSSVLRHA